MITVVGYGSLLYEASARKTVPQLKNFRLVEIEGHKRIFNKVGIVFIQTGLVGENSLYLSSCATRPDNNSTIICSAFECNDEDFLEIYDREHRFRWIEIPVKEKTGMAMGRMCTEYNDEDYRLNKCITDAVYHARVGRYYMGKIWRNDILPNKRYLALCLKAAQTHGNNVLNNFLDTSFLADGKTSLRFYLKKDSGAVDTSADDYYA